MKALRGMALLGALALGACAAESGQDENAIGMGGQGGIGGAGGDMLPGGAGGAAGAAGMMNVGGVGGAMATGGVGGGMPSGGVGGVAGMATGGVGGEAGMMMTGGMGGEAGMMMTGGMGGEAGMMMTGGTGGGGDWGPDKGMGDGTDVITIGDSYMNLNGREGTQFSLEKASGRTYRKYGVAGTQLLNGQIPGQFDSAVRENGNIKTVVITAGGNDILLGNIFCTVNWTEACNETVREVGVGHAELRDRMGMMGVEDVIWVHYGYSTNGRTPEPDPVLKPGLDLGRERAAEMCLPNAMPRCHFIDPVEELYGEIRSDGIHPTGAGYDILGQMVWDLMQERGIRR